MAKCTAGGLNWRVLTIFRCVPTVGARVPMIDASVPEVGTHVPKAGAHAGMIGTHASMVGTSVPEVGPRVPEFGAHGWKVHPRVRNLQPSPRSHPAGRHGLTASACYLRAGLASVVG
jgi:hypothetical protein